MSLGHQIAANIWRHHRGIIEVSSRFSRKTSCDKLSNARNLWRVVPLRSRLLPAGGLSGSKGRAQDVPSRISCGSLRFALPTFNSNWRGILLLQHASTNSEELQQKLPMSFLYRAAMILGLFRGRSGPVSLPSEHEEGLAIWVSTWSSYISSIFISEYIRIKSYSLFVLQSQRFQWSPETWPWKHNVLRNAAHLGALGVVAGLRTNE